MQSWPAPAPQAKIGGPKWGERPMFGWHGPSYVEAPAGSCEKELVMNVRETRIGGNCPPGLGDSEVEGLREILGKGKRLFPMETKKECSPSAR